MKNTTSFKTIIFFLLILLLGGCNIEKITDPIIVADIDNEFYLNLWQELYADHQDFHLRIETIEDSTCLNYEIGYELEKRISTINISLKDIIEPETCEAGKGPAKADINLGQLNPGNYAFSIDLKNTVFNEGFLTVTNSRYILDIEQENGIIFLHKEMFRIPDNTIWGYVAYPRLEDKPIALDFINELRNRSNEKTFEPGYYGFFNVKKDNPEPGNLHNRPNATHLTGFLFDYTGPMEDLKALLAAYREDFGTAIDIRLSTWKGEEL